MVIYWEKYKSCILSLCDQLIKTIDSWMKKIVYWENSETEYLNYNNINLLTHYKINGFRQMLLLVSTYKTIWSLH